MRYDRKKYAYGEYASYLPKCLCGDGVEVELIAHTFANETLHYRLGCTRCGKLGARYIAHDKIRPTSKDAAKPYSTPE